MAKCKYAYQNGNRCDAGSPADCDGRKNCGLPVFKKKPRMARIKAKIWNGYYASAEVEQNWKMESPCTILIDRKFLKGDKK